MTGEVPRAEAIDQAIRHALAGDAIDPKLVAHLLADEVLALRAHKARLADEAQVLRAQVEALSTETAQLRLSARLAAVWVQEYGPIVARTLAGRGGTDPRFSSLVHRRTADYILRGRA